MANSKRNVQKIREQISADIMFEDVYSDDKVKLAKEILEKDFTYDELEELKKKLLKYEINVN
jgi:hypothetical protein